MSEGKELHIQKLRTKVKELNAEINELTAEINKTHAQKRRECHNKLQALKAKRKDLRKEIEELQKGSEGVWDDFKQGIDNSWKILKTSVSRAKSEFKKGYKEGREE